MGCLLKCCRIGKIKMLISQINIWQFDVAIGLTLHHTEALLTCVLYMLRVVLGASCIRKQQRKRQKLLSEVCAKYFPASNNTIVDLISTSVNTDKGIVYCRVAKVSALFIITLLLIIIITNTLSLNSLLDLFCVDLV